MPARARTSGLAFVRSRPSKVTWPARGRNRPMTLLSSVVLPTPLRPMRQTSSPALTSRLTSRRICVSPYATDRLLTWSMLVPVLAQVDLDHARVALHLGHPPLAQLLSLVQHGDARGDLPDKCHVVVDDQKRVLLGQGQEQFAGA